MLRTNIPSRISTLTPLQCHGIRPNKRYPLRHLLGLPSPHPRKRPIICRTKLSGKRELDERCGKYPPPWFSVAPMMDWTDNHFRTLVRLISKHAWLYTEMIVAETIVHQQDNLDGGNIQKLKPNFGAVSQLRLKYRLYHHFGTMVIMDRFLAFPSEQHPIVLQIGGSNLDNLAKATKLADSYGYDEINLNCGCPSGKVAGHGCFGARLMLDPKFVGEAMSAIAANCEVPVSVKCRIGVDDRDSYEELCEFIDIVASNSPTRHFIIHARKALLNGLSPADNRKIPPLKYEYFFALLRDFPRLVFTINGGISSISQVNAAQAQGARNVMIGRAAYNSPWSILGRVDSDIYGAPRVGLTRRQVLKEYQEYGDAVLGMHGSKKPNIRQIVKPLLNLFHSEPGNSLWKRQADNALRHCMTLESFFEETLPAIPDSVLDSTLDIEPYCSEDVFARVHELLPPPYNQPEIQSTPAEMRAVSLIS